MHSITDVQKITALFTGNPEGYGITTVGDIINGKAEAKSSLVYGVTTPAIWEQHLQGRVSIGQAPLLPDDTVNFAAIDIDNYTGDLLHIVDAIQYYKLPVLPCYSKSKKLHLYFFFADAPKAEDVIPLLRWYASSFACDRKVEIFPKQIHTSSRNKFYSWINIPFFDADNPENWRKQVLPDGSIETDVSMSLSYAMSIKLDLKKHREALESLDWYDAPPCVRAGIMLRDIPRGTRNNWMFSAGVYFQLKDSNISVRDKLIEINSMLRDPLPANELEHTVIDGLSRKTYFYLCNAMPYCNKQECETSEHGINSTASTGLTFGSITKYASDPPYYKWDVNGQDMMFYSEADILNQSIFQQRCIRMLNAVFRKVPEEKWVRIITKAFSNMTVVNADTGGFDDFSEGATDMTIVSAFFWDRTPCPEITQVMRGRVFKDADNNEFVFHAPSLMSYMKDMGSRLLGGPLRNKMIDMGAYQDETGNWRIPCDNVPHKQKPKAVINFPKEDANGAF